MDQSVKQERYRQVRHRIQALIEGESDEIAVMATIACELHNSFEYFHWTGFYRVVKSGLLKIGPYQGGHGCLVIPFERGVCGAAAREAKTLRIDDVESFPGHIACSSTTKSEIVVPVMDKSGCVRAVLDVDSDLPAAFDEIDEAELTAICTLVI
ncbi:GAF domain-containing protein [Puniceicoccales bacterium CK1056]|uniref:GAF domain-containing protein n=1 Tax=Oceanipulchritudo coccoides TaxID=2706888 RepID=A0A6B2M3P8_9BACT|nr:GAF domain-containing protein [Oceanipulchritudo coccoides]NDV63588.1 GAF domain-containing protein [Oceanipulchritudo coccoides]